MRWKKEWKDPPKLNLWNSISDYYQYGECVCVCVCIFTAISFYDCCLNLEHKYKSFDLINATTCWTGRTTSRLGLCTTFWLWLVIVTYVCTQTEIAVFIHHTSCTLSCMGVSLSNVAENEMQLSNCHTWIDQTREKKRNRVYAECVHWKCISWKVKWREVYAVVVEMARQCVQQFWIGFCVAVRINCKMCIEHRKRNVMSSMELISPKWFLSQIELRLYIYNVYDVVVWPVGFRQCCLLCVVPRRIDKTSWNSSLISITFSFRCVRCTWFHRDIRARRCQKLSTFVQYSIIIDEDNCKSSLWAKNRSCFTQIYCKQIDFLVHSTASTVKNAVSNSSGGGCVMSCRDLLFSSAKCFRYRHVEPIPIFALDFAILTHASACSRLHIAFCTNHRLSFLFWPIHSIELHEIAWNHFKRKTFITAD